MPAREWLPVDMLLCQFKRQQLDRVPACGEPGFSPRPAAGVLSRPPITGQAGLTLQPALRERKAFDF
jgi:hypothetical protein